MPRNRRQRLFGKKLRIQSGANTWVSEDVGPEATIEALMSVLPYFRIAEPRARQMLREVEQAVSQWRPVGRSLGMSTRELDQFADAFEHEERAAGRNASQ